MLDLTDLLESCAKPGGRDWLAEAGAQLQSGGAHLPVLFPQLPRRIGREFLPAELRRDQDLGVVIDCGGWRACDTAALHLLTCLPELPDKALLADLYDHGDMEERHMLMRAMSCLPIGPITGRLLGEAQRTNHVNHVVAAALDSNLLARCLDAGQATGSGFGPDEFQRLMLKLVFLGLPLRRVFGATRHTTPELSAMIQGLATEREAAGRAVWHDTNRLIAHAPASGTIARVVGGLEHGDDEHRLAAAEGILTLNLPEFRPLVADRLEREHRPEIREALQRALDGLG